MSTRPEKQRAPARSRWIPNHGVESGTQSAARDNRRLALFEHDFLVMIVLLQFYATKVGFTMITGETSWELSLLRRQSFILDMMGRRRRPAMAII